MRIHVKLLAVLAAGLCFGAFPLFAATTHADMAAAQPITTVTSEDVNNASAANPGSTDAWGRFDVLPFRYAFVSGDTGKYRELHWQKEGYLGGVEDAELSYKGEDGVTAEVEGGAILGNGNYKGKVRISKADVGYIFFDYDQFRKYYDNKAGVYYPFNQLDVNGIRDRDLSMDIGEFETGMGLTLPDWPLIEFSYKHEYRDGDKSRLTWADVRDIAGTATPQRKIGPSWQELTESVNQFNIKVEKEIKGYELRGVQSWEFVDIGSQRWENYLSATTTGADTKIRRQDQNMDGRTVSTLIEASKWYLNDRLYSSTAYRYESIASMELENLREFNQGMVPFNYTNPEQRISAVSHVNGDDNTWVFNLMGLPTNWLSVGGKFRAERKSDTGASTYPGDIALGSPDGVIDRTEYSNMHSSQTRIGENFGVRFKAIPRTALFTEAELEQVEYWIDQRRLSIAGSASAPASSGENLLRGTETDTYRGKWKIGGDFMPVRMVNVTSQFAYSRSNNDFNNDWRVSGGTALLPGYIQEMDIATKEVETRVTLKPVNWFQPNFRYVIRDSDYFTRYGTEGEIQSTYLSDDITFGAMLIPMDRLFLTGAWTKMQNFIRTPAASNQIFNLPGFNSGSYLWTFGANYVVNEVLTLNWSYYLNDASNFDDYTNRGLPLGADFSNQGMTLSAKWKARSDLSIEPFYEFDRYAANSLASFGNFTANVIGLKGSYTWD